MILTDLELELLMRGKSTRDYGRDIESAATAPLLERIAELEQHLEFVERWAVHHGSKPSMTPQEALAVIQHYPPIKAITRQYKDGKEPQTFDPYKRIAELERELATERVVSFRDQVAQLERELETVRNEVLEEAAKVADEKYQEMASKGFPREASTARALAKTYRSIKQNL
jgi:hypothetical protein